MNPSRVLQPREEKVKKEFSVCGLEKINIENATMGNKDSVYMINGALLYRIKNTNSYLLFGDPVNYSSILERLKNSANNPDELKKLFSENMDLDREQEEIKEIEGEPEIQEETDLEIQKQESSIEYNENDVQLIMDEAKISKENAIEALKNANNDVIQALVDLNKK